MPGWFAWFNTANTKENTSCSFNDGMSTDTVNHTVTIYHRLVEILSHHTHIVSTMNSHASNRKPRQNTITPDIHYLTMTKSSLKNQPRFRDRRNEGKPNKNETLGIYYIPHKEHNRDCHDQYNKSADDPLALLPPNPVYAALAIPGLLPSRVVRVHHLVRNLRRERQQRATPKTQQSGGV